MMASTGKSPAKICTIASIGAGTCGAGTTSLTTSEKIKALVIAPSNDAMPGLLSDDSDLTLTTT
jgi:hypothetical protein